MLSPEEILNFAIGQIPIPVIIASAPDVTITHFNQAAIGLLTRADTELTEIPLEVHREYWPTFYPDGTPYRVEDLPLTRAIQKGETSKDVEIIVRQPDGDRWISASAAPLRDNNGTIVAGIVVFPEITKRKKSESALQEQEALLAAIYRNAPLVLMVVDSERRVQQVNGFAAQFAGRDAEEMLNLRGGEALRCLHALDDPKGCGFGEYCQECVIRNTVLDTLETGATHLEVEAPYYFQKNENEIQEMTFLASTTSITVKDRMMALVTLQNITERKRMEEELLKARNLESLGVLAGGIAHDFNNILTAILGNISYVRMDIDKDSEADESLEDAEAACRQAQNLTRQLLTFSSGGRPITRTASLEKILRDAAGFSLHGSNVECRFRLAKNLWPVRADPGQIAQVINNLVINADQAMPDGGAIEIRGLNQEVAENQFSDIDPGKYVRIEIADQGIGIGPEQLSRIFDPYFTTKEKGRGLGLATTFSIIRNHHGLITAESEPGEGTVFTILLPAADQTIDEEEKEEKIIRGKGRILVMDDEEAVLMTSVRILQSLGYHAETARDGDEAVHKYKEACSGENPYDAVILDLTVKGGMGGEKTLEELKKIDPEVRAIVSSGYSTDGVMADHRSAGFAGMIAKPYEIKTVSQVLADILS